MKIKISDNLPKLKFLEQVDEDTDVRVVLLNANNHYCKIPCNVLSISNAPEEIENQKYEISIRADETLNISKKLLFHAKLEIKIDNREVWFQIIKRASISVEAELVSQGQEVKSSMILNANSCNIVTKEELD